MARSAVNAKALRELAHVLVEPPAHQTVGEPATIGPDVLRWLKELIPSDNVVFHDSAWRQWSDTVYDEAFACDRVLTIPLPDRPGHSRRIRFERVSGRDFDDTDRAIAFVVRPLLVEHLIMLDLISDGITPLTVRQRQLMALVSDGYSNVQAARTLGITEATVRTHLSQIYARLGVTSRSEAVARVRWFGGNTTGARDRQDTG